MTLLGFHNYTGLAGVLDLFTLPNYSFFLIIMYLDYILSVCLLLSGLMDGKLTKHEAKYFNFVRYINVVQWGVGLYSVEINYFLNTQFDNG